MKSALWEYVCKVNHKTQQSNAFCGWQACSSVFTSTVLHSDIRLCSFHTTIKLFFWIWLCKLESPQFWGGWPLNNADLTIFISQNILKYIVYSDIYPSDRVNCQGKYIPITLKSPKTPAYSHRQNPDFWNTRKQIGDRNDLRVFRILRMDSYLDNQPYHFFLSINPITLSFIFILMTSQ